MTIREAIDYYRRFVEINQRISWNPACWTIVKVGGDPPNVHDIGRNLSRSGNCQVLEMDIEEGGFEIEGLVLFVKTFDGGYFLLDVSDMYGSEDSVIRFLSEDAAVWSLSWTGVGHSRFVYAESGELLVKSHNLNDLASAHGAASHIFDEEMVAVREICQRENRLIAVPEIMALMEVTAGIRLAEDFVQGMQTALVVDRPVR